jgi:Trypsin
MRRLISTAVALASLAAAAPAGAITYGELDGNGHPNVGGLVASEQFSDGTWLYCSGTLIAPTVFLTAAHCAEEDPSVRVTFDPDYQAGDTVYTGTFQADPLYNQSQSDPHDIAVVVLDSAPPLTPAQLPEARSLSDLSGNQRFTSVGYGAYGTQKGGVGHGFLYDDVRRVATGTLSSINKAWLRISMNPAKGDGGTCYGDSGGPNFLGRTDIIAATTITGDTACRATNVDYRLDTASARSFLDDYVTLP